MSSRRCNYCVFSDFIKLAQQRGHAISSRPAPMPGVAPEGVDVYIHPRHYCPPDHRTVTDPESANTGPGEWWAGWFASLPKNCCCNE